MPTLGVDPGEKRIGIAISDQTGTLARPLAIIRHVSREKDAGRVAQLAAENLVSLIVIGQSFEESGAPNAAGRRAARFAEALKAHTAIPTLMWDESLSTQDARAARVAVGASRKRRARPVDAIAASIILQSYLDAHPGPGHGGATS